MSTENSAENKKRQCLSFLHFCLDHCGSSAAGLQLAERQREERKDERSQWE